MNLGRRRLDRVVSQPPGHVVAAGSALLLAALLAGCNGGGGPPVVACADMPAFAGATGVGWENVGVTFDADIAEQFLGCDEFNFVNADYETPPGGLTGTQSNPYALHNVNWAHSAGVTGAGTLVHVVDGGFRTTHQELVGQIQQVFGFNTPNDHGTHVAALIAGNADDVGMRGIAPGTKLLLSNFQSSIAALAADTNQAAGLGAVAQNNSWAYTDISIAQVQAASGTLAQRLAVLVGYPAQDWADYIAALDNFQNSGVIVWALANDGNGSFISALPFFAPQLAEAWIAAANGFFTVDGNGAITGAHLLSIACGVTAAYCIAGDGTTWSASANSNSSYDGGTGTSYVTPQISAAVALLAEAFPSLSPQEWRDRLLATANNGWFAAEGVTDVTTMNFVNGITHDYSSTWGHGVLDIRAALAPIGTVFLMAGNTVQDAERIALTQGAIATGAGFGDGLEQALAGQRLAVFDALNANFAIDADALVAPGAAGLMPALLQGTDPFATRTTLAASGGAGGARLAATSDLAGYLYGTSGRTSVLSLADDAAVVSATVGGNGPFGLSLYGFAADHGAVGVNEMAGVGAIASLDLGGTGLTVGVSQSFEHGALLGLVGNPVFDFGSGSRIMTANAGFTQDIGQNFSIFGNVEVGVAHATGSLGGSVIAAIGPIGFNGFSVGATARSLLSDRDSLTFSFSQPMRVNSGAVDMNLPTGRTVAGDITTTALTAALAPSGRQRDLALTYGIGLGASSEIRLSAIYSLDAGNVGGEHGFGVAAGYGFTF